MKLTDETMFLLMREFLNLYLPKQKCCSKNTVISYKTSLNMFVDYLSEKLRLPLYKLTLGHFTSNNINSFLLWLSEERNCSSSTQNQRLMALRSFINYSSKHGVENVTIKTEIEKVPVRKSPGKVIEFLSEDALKTLFEQPTVDTKIGLRNRFIMILIYDTGARCQEILDLRIKDFELGFKNPYVYLTGKNNKTRTVPLLKKTVEHLEQYISIFHPVSIRDKEDYLFYAVSHNVKHQLSIDTVEYFMKSYGVSARELNPNVPERVHPHQLRHSRAIHLYRSGIPLTLIAEYLGHSHTKTTQIYAYADTEMKRIAIEKATTENTSSELLSNFVYDDNTIKRLYGLA